PRPVAAATGRARRLSRPLQHLAEPVRQARLHAGTVLRRPPALPLLRERSRVLDQLLLRQRIRGRDHGAAAGRRRAGGPAPERGVPRAQPAAGGRAVPLHDPHHRGGHPVEVAAQRLLRPRQLPPGQRGRGARPGGLARTRLHHDRADRHQRVAVLPVRGGDLPGAATDHRARAVRGRDGGRGLGVAAIPARDPAPDRERALRHRSPAQHLDVPQVRPGVAAGRRRRGEPLHPNPAGVRLRPQLHLPAGRHGRLAGRDHVRDAPGRHRGVLPHVQERGGLLVRRAGALYGAGLVLLLAAAFPLFWMLSTALKPSGEIFATPRFVALHPPLENFRRLFADTSFFVFFRNSVLVAGATVLLTLAVSSLGAYALTRYRFRGRDTVAGLILLTYMFAPIMIIIPFYILVKQLGIVNTHLALVLPYTTFCLPFCLWVLRAFFQSIPLDLEEAALVDGAGRGRTVWYVVLPLALPGLIAAAIFTFILAWNDFLFALVLITSEELKTLPVGVNDLFNATIVDWGMIMAAGVVITVPTIAFFVAVQRYLIQGWGAGGVKG